MNKKLWALLWAATLTITWCNTWEHNIKDRINSISQEIGIVFSDKEQKDEWTIDYNEAINRESPYKYLIEKTDSPIISGDVTRSEIAVTIDDWNGDKNIDAILDTLAKYDVKATFFIVWTRIKMHADQRRRAIDEWHQICNHTYDHHYFRKIDTVELEKQIMDWESAVISSLWQHYLDSMKTNFPFFRFPWWCGDSKPEHIEVLKNHWYLPIWRSDDRWKPWKNIPYWSVILYHFKWKDFGKISWCIQEARAQWLECRQITDIVDPGNWYEEPITRKNLRAKRKEAEHTKTENF